MATMREMVKVLMESPLYWTMTVRNRLAHVKLMWRLYGGGRVC